MQCRTMSSQRPCGWENCEREDCKTARTILRVRENQEIAHMTEEALREGYNAYQRVLRLISNQPGYATFTVKQILGAINDEE